jgi:hypothetical protein
MLRYLVKGSQFDDFRDRARCFIDFAVDNKGIEFVGKWTWLSVFYVVRDFPFEISAPFIVALK